MTPEDELETRARKKAGRAVLSGRDGNRQRNNGAVESALAG
jgi:hypothetical protein